MKPPRPFEKKPLPRLTKNKNLMHYRTQADTDDRLQLNRNRGARRRICAHDQRAKLPLFRLRSRVLARALLIRYAAVHALRTR